MKKLTDQSLTNTFIDLVKIPSPSGEEEKVAKYIFSYLTKLRWKVLFDDTKNRNNSNTGNVIAHHEGSSKAILFVAHMDTVQSKGQTIKPQFDGENFCSDGTTILGSDNKAAVAVLLAVASTLSEIKDGNIWLAFTTREETGDMGARYLNLKQIKPAYVFNIDGSLPVGTFDYASLGQLTFEINIQGKAAHAATNPAKGINALSAAVKLLKVLPMGKFEDGTTFNIGYINGGEKTNIVMDNVTVRGEIRAYSEKILEIKFSQLKNKISMIAKQTRTNIKLTIKERVPPFNGTKNSKICKKLSQAFLENGIKPNPQAAPYSSDSSYLSQHGYPTITICKGGKDAHSHTESITLSEMKKIYNVLLYICYHIRK